MQCSDFKNIAGQIGSTYNSAFSNASGIDGALRLTNESVVGIIDECLGAGESICGFENMLNYRIIIPGIVKGTVSLYISTFLQMSNFIDQVLHTESIFFPTSYYDWVQTQIASGGDLFPIESLLPSSGFDQNGCPLVASNFLSAMRTTLTSPNVGQAIYDLYNKLDCS